jgi:hypothetical protein
MPDIEKLKELLNQRTAKAEEKKTSATDDTIKLCRLAREYGYRLRFKTRGGEKCYALYDEKRKPCCTARATPLPGRRWKVYYPIIRRDTNCNIYVGLRIHRKRPVLAAH